MHAMRLLCATLVIALVAPVNAQELGVQNPYEPTQSTMYIHLNDIQDAPINTQRPDDKYYAGETVGLVEHSQGCVENPGGSLLSKAEHTSYAYSTPGYVQYDIDEGNKPRFHNERGISYDVELDGSQDVVFRYFLESQLIAGNTEPNPNMIPALAPQVVMRATIREGDAISVGKTAYNEGSVIAIGQSEPAFMAGPLTPEHPHMTYHDFQGRHLYGFEFPLTIDQDVIRKDESFNVRVDIFMANPACEDVANDAYLMLDWVRAHTSAAHRPSFDWFVMNPLKISTIHPQLVGDELVVHAHVNSAWGNYDILGDEYDGGAKPHLRIEGPSIPVGLQLAAYHNDHAGHNGHTNPIALAWSWDTLGEKAKQGTYHVYLEAVNDQETARATAVAQFEVGSDHRVTTVTGCGQDGDGCLEEKPPVKPVAKNTPAPFGLVALAAALLLRRAQ